MTTVGEKVILVHGTFATSKDDCGEAWWQVGSPTYRALKERLPAQVDLVGNGNVFRWSGENSERARSKAAAQLLDFLRAYETEGQRYHLIGHSHGGSVIWSALKLATIRRKELRQLQSWSTVGTPFLHQRSRSPWNVINLAYAIGAALLLYPALKLLYFLSKLLHDVAFGKLTKGIIITSDENIDPLMAIVRAPIIKTLEILGVEFKPIEAGIQVGSFSAESIESPSMFLFGSLEGWLILGAALFSTYLTILLLSFCIGPVSEVLRITWEKQAEQKAFASYGCRWLGVWTKDDEAINGLKKTLELTVSFVGNIVPRERIFVSDLTGLPSRPLVWLAAPIYNRIIRPVLDSTIRGLVVKAAQGNNRPAAQVVAVSPHPLYSVGNAALELPDWLSQQILRKADWHAQEIGKKLRASLAEPTFSIGIEKFGRALVGRELVHTSYFDHPEVLELLAMNIGETRTSTRPRNLVKSQQLRKWFAHFKVRLGEPHVDQPEQTPEELVAMPLRRVA